MKSARYRIYFYRSITGRCQACDYARSMSVGHQAKVKRWFVALGRDGVWELRIIIQHHQHRFLYSFRKDTVVVTNAFLKKSRSVPEGEIQRSLEALADWLSREES